MTLAAASFQAEGKAAKDTKNHPKENRRIRSLEYPPTASRWMMRWFTLYCRIYIRRHFHSLRISLSGMPPQAEGLPLVIYSNHASWWDPLVFLVLKSEFFPSRKACAPIDAEMLRRYAFFKKLGFVGVERGSIRGARDFLATMERILGSPEHLLALTPQNGFVDIRQRPVQFASGLGHIATLGQPAVFVPVATEYVFWEERLPEILVRFGESTETVHSSQPDHDARSFTSRFERNLMAAQDALAVESQRRNAADFKTILRGGAGQGGVYDLWRHAKASLRGQSFSRDHGTK